MRRWHNVMAAVAFFASASLATAEEAKPVDEAAVAAARDLMEVTGVSKQMDAMIDVVSAGFAKGAAEAGGPKNKEMADEFNSAIESLKSFKKDMMTDFAKLYSEKFTAAEMKEVADFYRTGTGSKFIAAMPELMQKGAEIGMKYSEKMMKTLQQPPQPQ